MNNVNCWRKGTKIIFKRSSLFLFVLSDWHKVPKFDYITHKEETLTTYSNVQRNSLWPCVNFYFAVSSSVRDIFSSLLNKVGNVNFVSNNRNFWICAFVCKYKITVYINKYILESLSLQNMFRFGRKMYIWRWVILKQPPKWWRMHWPLFTNVASWVPLFADALTKFMATVSLNINIQLVMNAYVHSTLSEETVDTSLDCGSWFTHRLLPRLSNERKHSTPLNIPIL